MTQRMQPRPGRPPEPIVVVGGSGFIGRHLVEALLAAGHPVTSIDRHRPHRAPHPHLRTLQVDLLRDPLDLPPGRVVVAAGASDPRTLHPWTLALDNAVATARLAPSLTGREVVLLSSVEVYGRARGPIDEDTPTQLPVDDEALRSWCEEAGDLARRPCPPERVAALCRDLDDPGGRWTYGLSKRAQELVLGDALPVSHLTTIRLANLFGPGQERVVARLARRARAGLPLVVTDTVRSFLPVEDVGRIVRADPGPGTWVAGSEPVSLPDLTSWIAAALDQPVVIERRPAPVDDASGEVDARRLVEKIGPPPTLRPSIEAFARSLDQNRGPLLQPALPVVVPPRPRRPDVVAGRTIEALSTGRLKHGNHWTTELTQRLAARLGLGADRTLLLTTSGTSALTLAVVALAGRAEPGATAVLPSFTFAATADVVAQLGYRPVFCDVDPDSWTLDPTCLEDVLAHHQPQVVITVDALGLPSDYPAIRAVCRGAGVPLVADSAPALGAAQSGRPIGTQADTHAFSMSFAKVLTSAGAGGAVVVPTDAVAALDRPVHWLRSALMSETHAIAALDQLDDLDLLLARRKAVADVYAELATHRRELRPQLTAPGDRHAHVHWVTRIGVAGDGRRDAVRAALEAQGVRTKPYYGPALHRHQWPGTPPGDDADLPVTSDLVDTALALPMSSEMTVEQADLVTVALDAALVENGPPIELNPLTQGDAVR